MPSQYFMSRLPFATCTLSVLVFLCTSNPCDASIIRYNISGIGGDTCIATLDQDDSASTLSASEVYDNARAAGSEVPGGFRLGGTLRSGNTELADDLSLSGYEGGTLNTMGFSFVNYSTTGRLQQFRTRLRWYQPDTLEILGELLLNIRLTGGLGPNARAYGLFPPDFLTPFNITIQDRVLWSLLHFEPIGIDAADLGQIYGGPTNTGSSSRFLRDLTNNQTLDLGENQNLMLSLSANPIPAPATLPFIAASGIFALRRRRS